MDRIEPQRGTAVALGFFDGVHRGHQAVIGQTVELAREKGLEPCVFTFTTRRGRPDSKRSYTALCTERERTERIRSLGVGPVFCPEFESFQGLSGEEFVRDMLIGTYGARVLCCGKNFRFGKRAAWGTDEMEALCGRYGARLHLVPAVLESGEPISSTRIRALLRAGEVEAAERLLGRPYGFAFEVVHGRRLGRTMRFPTINQPFPAGFTLPRFGVYASFAQVAGVWRPAVTNIGVKPTVDEGAAPLAETYISGVDADLYGRCVPVELAAFLRPEEKFASVEELRLNIQRDRDRAFAVCRSKPRAGTVEIARAATRTGV